MEFTLVYLDEYEFIKEDEDEYNPGLVEIREFYWNAPGMKPREIIEVSNELFERALYDIKEDNWRGDCDGELDQDRYTIIDLKKVTAADIRNIMKPNYFGIEIVPIMPKECKDFFDSRGVNRYSQLSKEDKLLFKSLPIQDMILWYLE